MAMSTVLIYKFNKNETRNQNSEHFYFSFCFNYLDYAKILLTLLLNKLVRNENISHCQTYSTPYIFFLNLLFFLNSSYS